MFVLSDHFFLLCCASTHFLYRQFATRCASDKTPDTGMVRYLVRVRTRTFRRRIPRKKYSKTPHLRDTARPVLELAYGVGVRTLSPEGPNGEDVSELGLARKRRFHLRRGR